MSVSTRIAAIATLKLANIHATRALGAIAATPGKHLFPGSVAEGPCKGSMQQQAQFTSCLAWIRFGRGGTVEQTLWWMLNAGFLHGD